MKIALLTPNYSSLVNVDYCSSLLQTIQLIKSSECMWFTVKGNSMLPMARNSLAAKAMAWGADKLVFIDDDMSWTPEGFQRLVTAPAKIVGGVYQTRPHTVEDLKKTPNMAMSMFKEGMTVGPNGLIELEGLATGFLRVDREVFEAMKASCVRIGSMEEDEAVKAEMYEYFHYARMFKNNETWIAGEDYTFCRKAREHGFKCYTDPNIKLGHHVGQFRFGAHLQTDAIL